MIDNHPVDSPFTLAIEGEWGSGKTSLLNCLEQQLLNRKNDIKSYFILKIDTLLFKTNNEIISYIKSYFKALFLRYNVNVINNKKTENYLDLIMKLLGVNDTINTLFHNILSNADDFININNEKTKFEKKIKKLLLNSRKNKIIFLVDDTDRNENEDTILILLKEVFDIKGIYNIVLRKEGNRSESLYSKLDKFINMRIKLNENFEDIENDKQLNMLLKIGCERYISDIETKDIMLVNCSFEKILDLYYFTAGSQTFIIDNNGAINGLNNDRDMLFDIILLDIYYNDFDFGNKIEEIIMNYLKNVEQVKRTENNIKNDDMKSQYINSWNNIYWSNNNVSFEFSWLNKVWQFTDQPLIFLPSLIECINNNVTSLNKCKTIEDIYDVWKLSNGIMPMYLDDGSKFPETQFIYACETMFSTEEKREIQDNIDNKQFYNINGILNNKLRLTVKMKVIIIILNKFIEYLRKSLNNPRNFKIQIRDANLNCKNLIIYIIEQIDFTNEMNSTFTKYNLHVESYEGKELLWFIQKSAYYKYIYLNTLDRIKINKSKKTILLKINEYFDLVYFEYEENSKENELEINIRVIALKNNSNYDCLNDKIFDEIFNVIKLFPDIKNKRQIKLSSIDNENEYKYFFQ